MIKVGKVTFHPSITTKSISLFIWGQLDYLKPSRENYNLSAISCLQNPVHFSFIAHHSQSKQEHAISTFNWSCSCVLQLISHSASKIRHPNKHHSCLRWVCLFSYLTGQGGIFSSCFLTSMYYLQINLKLLPYRKPSFLIGGRNPHVTKEKTKMYCSLGSRRLFRNQSLKATPDPKFNSQSMIRFHF